MDYKIRNIELPDTDALKEFTDRWIGIDYFTKEELRSSLILGIKDDLNASFLALDSDNNIVGVRITYAPGDWINNPKLNIPVNSHLWKTPEATTAYFQSLFVTNDYQNLGLGRDLTTHSLEVLHKMNAMAVVCHAWIESPNDSSRRFLKKLKFEQVEKHKNFWFFKEYNCIRCAPANCSCSADEMIYYFNLADDEEEEIIQGTR